MSVMVHFGLCWPVDMGVPGTLRVNVNQSPLQIHGQMKSKNRVVMIVKRKMNSFPVTLIKLERALRSLSCSSCE